MKFSMIVAAGLLAGSTVALAQEADENAATQVSNSPAAPSEGDGAEEDDPGQEIVCRRERVTGSLTRVRRTCLTVNEWAQVEANTRDDMIRSGRNASGSQCINTNPLRPDC